MVDTLSISLQGLQQAELRFERAARNIAAGQSPASASPAADDSFQLSARGDSAVDYVRDVVTIIESKTAAEANLKVMGTQREMDRTTLDLLA